MRAACVLLAVSLAAAAPAPQSHASGSAAALATGTTVTADTLRALLDRLQYGEAERQARRLLAALEAQGRADTAAARVLDLLVEALWSLGKSNHAETDSLSERAVLLKQALYGPEHPEVARSLHRRAFVLARAGKHAAARPVAERSLKIRRKVLGPDHPETADGLYSLANLDYDEGKYSQAAAVYRQALAIYERSLGAESALAAQMLHNLGIAHRAMGDYIAAKGYYERAIAIRERVFGPDSPKVAQTLNNLANVLHELGDLKAVERHRRRAVAIFEKALGPEHPDVAFNLTNLGNVLVALGDSAGARPLYQRALAIQERVLGPEHPDLSRTLNNLAKLLADEGDLESAAAMYRRSVAIREKVFGPTHPEVAFTLLRLAWLHELTGDDSLALATYARAVELRRQGYGPDHPLTGEAMAGYAFMLARLGRDSLAVVRALEADEVAIRHFRLTVRSLEERAAALYAEHRMSSREVALTLAVRRSTAVPGLDSLAWDALIRARALVLDELAARKRAIAESSDPEIERLAAEVMEARERLAELVVAGPSPKDRSEHPRRVERAQERRGRAERALAEKSARFRATEEARQVGLPEVLSALPEGSALVGYACYSRVEPWPRRADGTRARADMTPWYVAFVARAGQPTVSLVDLGPADGLEALVARWAELAGRKPAPAQLARLERSCRAAGLALRERTWDPLAVHLQGVDQVLLVPDGALHLVNFGALPAAGKGFLIEHGPALHLLSAERDVVTFAEPGPLGRGLLAFGAAEFDPAGDLSPSKPSRGATRGISEGAAHPVPGNAPEPHTPKAAGVAEPPDALRSEERGRGRLSDCADFASLRFVPLPGTAREIEEVRALWSSAKTEAPGTTLLHTGRDASEAAFKRLAPGRRALHLATHGFFLPADCSGAAGAARMEASAGAASPEVARENPLLRAGLALAGANLRRSPDQSGEDGILTAEEIAALDLGGLEWAVLSACQTGAGEVKAGEGVLGMRRAFQLAGARTVVMSLWSADDESTRRWMAALYRARLARRLDTATAVRSASLEVLEARRALGRNTHPYYWAGFLAAGDWR